VSHLIQAEGDLLEILTSRLDLPRLVRTLSLVPPGGGLALELGSYVYTAGALDGVKQGNYIVD